jgi:hypothetical protein
MGCALSFNWAKGLTEREAESHDVALEVDRTQAETKYRSLQAPIYTIDVLHHEVRPALGRGACVENPCDVRVVHHRQCLALLGEAGTSQSASRSARPKSPITFAETHKLWFDANHKAIIRGADNAIWNRLHLIPFNVSIPDDEIDQDLPAKLAAEAEGILAWAVAAPFAGTLKGSANRLKRLRLRGNTARKWTRSAASSMNAASSCLPSPPALSQLSRMGRRRRRKNVMAETTFATCLAERSIEKSRTDVGMVYAGIGIRSERNPVGQ